MKQIRRKKTPYIIWLFRYGIWDWIKDLKWKIPNYLQRGWRGWGDADTWNFDVYLSKVIYEGIKHLYDEGHMGYIEFVTYADDATKINEKVSQEMSDIIMKKILHAFKLAKEIGEGKRDLYLPALDSKHQRKLKCLTKVENTAMKEGMRLFADYFFHFWS
jgi:hypothetical protein